MNSRFIPQRGFNPIVMMQQFKNFKHDYYAQNGANADPKQAVMDILSENGIDSNEFISQGTQIANQFGIH